jgi:hypothetical protein
MKLRTYYLVALLLMVFGLNGCAQEAADQQAIELTDAQVDNIVRRSYQYVAMYNVNNKFAMDPTNPMSTGGWNRIKANTALADHTLKAIARPNNDTLYIAAMLDLHEEPIILEAPAFDSIYVSLMVTGYDHYVNIPMSTRLGDFSEPSRILFYTERTPRYAGEAIDGVDRIAEMSGDFVSAVFRVMPHANEPERLQRILEAIQDIKIMTLSEFLSGTAAETGFPPEFPAYGETDFDVFENNLLEVMQFVFNHTTFDADDEIDRKALAAYEPLGVVPGRTFDASKVAQIDGARFRKIAEQVSAEILAGLNDAELAASIFTDVFKPQGEMASLPMLTQSIIGPIGQPIAEAAYPPIASVDGTPLNAMNDYVVRMAKDELPPAMAFWSVTLYDTENGFFLPNDRKKYSVGENAGMKLDANGGIAIYLAAERPNGVPEENWLPMTRGDYGVDLSLRIYAPDLERFENWDVPKAEKIK